MKNRARQRANRRKYNSNAGQTQASTAVAGCPQHVEKPWLNHEGYNDPTAYRAIRNAERERRSAAHGRSTAHSRSADYN